MNNIMVERVAKCVYTSRGRKGPSWEELQESRRNGYRDHVREVLLAAMNAGYGLREVSIPPPPEGGSS